MKIVVYWEHSDEESTAKKAAKYLLSLFRKRGMPQAEILVRSVGQGLADEAQRLADQMEAAFGSGPSDYMRTYEDEVRVLAAQTHALPRSAPNPVYLGSHMSSMQMYGMISQADSPDKLKATLDANGFHDLGMVAEDGFTTFTPGVHE